MEKTMKDKLQQRLKNINETVSKVSEKGKRLVDNTKDNAQKLHEKILDENQKKLLKKLNPVFWDDYNSESFRMPYMIVITTDIDRKDIELCNGAIGWKSTQKDMEILHLYDKSVSETGLKFVPAPTKDSFYYVDDLDRNRYIKLDNYFDTMQEAMVAELADIAFSLGAKSYTIDLEESASEFMSDKKKGDLKAKLPFGIGKDKQELKFSEDNVSKIRKSTNIANKSNFSNGAPPRHPNLKIFKNNDLINGLINMRLESYMNNNKMDGYSIEIKKSSYTSMNKTMANSVDAAVKKINVKADLKMEKKREKIEEQVLIYQIQF